MIYFWLNMFFLLIAVGIAISLSRQDWISRKTLIIMLPMIILTVMFDNILTGLPIVTYVSENISGLKIGTSPMEDFAYTVAAVILVPALSRKFFL